MHCLRDFKFDILSLKSREKMKIVDWRFFTVGYIHIKRYNIEWRCFFFIDPIKISYVEVLSFTFYFYFLVAKAVSLGHCFIRRLNAP